MSAAQFETITLGGGCFWCLQAAYLLVDGVTEVLPLTNYSRAKDYHQRYFEHHPGQVDCAYVVVPEVGKVRHTLASRVRSAA